MFKILTRKKALAKARKLGCSVERILCTGEVRVKHPSILKSVKVNNRRKDATRTLLSFIRNLEKQQCRDSSAS